jgi:dUTP pyrophosphatase
MKVPVHRIDPSLPLPQFHTKGSFAFDFIARETIEVLPGEVQLVPGNVIVECPDNLALLILPRSSLFRKKSLILPNSPGLIDQDYCGAEDEIKIQVLNLGKEKVIVERGDRIAQGLFVRTETIEFVETDRPAGDSRGGFGSTGHK